MKKNPQLWQYYLLMIMLTYPILSDAPADPPVDPPAEPAGPPASRASVHEA